MAQPQHGQISPTGLRYKSSSATAIRSGFLEYHCAATMVEGKGAETRLSLCNNQNANSRKASVDQAKRREQGRRRRAIKVTDADIMLLFLNLGIPTCGTALMPPASPTFTSYNSFSRINDVSSPAHPGVGATVPPPLNLPPAPPSERLRPPAS